MSVWARLYRRRRTRPAPLYTDAQLVYAPGVAMTLVPGDEISDSIAFTGVYESALSRRVALLAKEGGTLVDVGANLGYVTLLWVAARPDNRCIAFEASGRNIELLRHNVQRNGFEMQVTVVAKAAGREAGRRHFHPGFLATQTGTGGFLPEDRPGGIEVDVVRIDEVVPAAPIALLKIDIEGADSWALMGCDRLLRAGMVNEVWFEQNKPRMRELGIPLDAAQEYLRSFGFAPRPVSPPTAEVVEWCAVHTSGGTPPSQ